MLLKFIAHDLRCHIVVFDLQLGITQFCSANRLKENNVLFDSPLLMYYTGNHFQSVLPNNHASFIDIANGFERETNITTIVPPNVCSDKMNKANSCIIPRDGKHKTTCLPIIEDKSEQNPVRDYQSKQNDLEEIVTLEQLKGIKHKTDHQKKLYEKLRKQAQRQNQNMSEKSIQKEKDRKRKSDSRARQSDIEKKKSKGKGQSKNV